MRARFIDALADGTEQLHRVLFHPSLLRTDLGHFYGMRAELLQLGSFEYLEEFGEIQFPV